MKFTIKDRLAIPVILPVKGKFEELVVADDLKNKLGIKQEDIAKYKIRQVDGGFQWEPTEDCLEIDLTELEKALMKKQLRERSDKGELTVDLINLYRMFCI